MWARRSEACIARKSCGYYPDSPNREGSIYGDVNHLGSDFTYNEVYPPGGDE